MAIVKLNEYKISQKDGKITSVNAPTMVDALQTEMFGVKESPVTQACLVQENVATLVSAEEQKKEVELEVGFDGEFRSVGAFPTSASVHVGDKIRLTFLNKDANFKLTIESISVVGTDGDTPVIIAGKTELNPLQEYSFEFTVPALSDNALTNHIHVTANCSWQTEDTVTATATAAVGSPTADGCFVYPDVLEVKRTGESWLLSGLAVAKGNWTFKHWEINKREISTNAILADTITTDLLLEAKQHGVLAVFEEQ